MTALQKFLKQIVLKQVEGSVYLVPAICDFQIEEALEEERKQGQNLTSRSDQFRERLEKYKKELEPIEFPDWMIDDIMNAYNEVTNE